MSVNLFKDLGYDENSVEVKNARASAAMYADVIDQLVSCREYLGLTQKQLAKQMRTSQSTVSEFESANADARFSTLIRYAQAVGCEMVIEITPNKVNSLDWVRVSVTEDAIVIPLQTRRERIARSTMFSPAPASVDSRFSNYLLAGSR